MNQKVAYPQHYQYQAPYKKENVKEWKTLRLQLASLIRAYPEYTRQELLHHLTGDWSSEERARFDHWLRFYDHDEDLKYSTSDRLFVKTAGLAISLARRHQFCEADVLRNVLLNVCIPYKDSIASKTLQTLMRWGAADFPDAGIIENEIKVLSDELSAISSEYDLSFLTWEDIKGIAEEKAPAVKQPLSDRLFGQGAEDPDQEWDLDVVEKALVELRKLAKEQSKSKPEPESKPLLEPEPEEQLATEEDIAEQDEIEPTEEDEGSIIRSAQDVITSYSVDDLRNMGPEHEWPDILEEQFYDIVGWPRYAAYKEKINGTTLLEAVKESPVRSWNFDVSSPLSLLEFEVRLSNPDLNEQELSPILEKAVQIYRQKQR